MTTPLYASLLAFWLVILSVRVIALRGNPAFSSIAFGKNGNETLERAIRGQANLTEYAPTFLILLFLAEATGTSTTAIHAYGLTFLAGRLAHGICFGFMTRSMALRVGGTALTFASILGLAAQLLLRYL
jgi:uncharacterized membrane protein YecN with MAPEG domain